MNRKDSGASPDAYHKMELLLICNRDFPSFCQEDGATLKGWISDGLLMNPTMKTLPLLLTALALPAISNAQFNYLTNHGTISITKYTGSDTVVTIPDRVGVFPVTSIGDLAFYSTGVTGVTIPNSVTNIGSEAFLKCGDLTSIVIPNSVTNIGDGALSYCTSLTDATLPNRLKNIDDGTFAICSSLTHITIPATVTNIGFGAFSSCYSLTNLLIPSSVVTIHQAFGWCYALQNVTISNGLVNLGWSAFNNCTSLTNVTLPDSLMNLDSYAFDYCSSLSAITIPGNVTNIGPYAFRGCSSLTTIRIPDRVRNIPDYTFNSCSSLASVTLSGLVTNIGTSAFGGCYNLASLYFKGNAPIVASDALLDATSATVYYLPGTTGWGTTFASLPTVLWNPKAQTTDGSFGVRTNRFGFNITGSSDLVIVVEACTNLQNPSWFPVGTNTLTGGASYFSDPQWTNQPRRFYRFRSP